MAHIGRLEVSEPFQRSGGAPSMGLPMAVEREVYPRYANGTACSAWSGLGILSPS